MSVEIYIKINNEFKRIDLFKDETISVNSSIQNINDLSKVFTDFSQSFTIPASANNNIIFNYWNENGIVNDAFDHRIRCDAKIELDTIPFRDGKIQIEKANEKMNEMESFTITFYGNTKQLKDLFKEEELSVLDYSSLNHTYDYANIVGRVDGSILSDVRYPIVGAKARYEYLTGSANDVTIGGTTASSIVYSDLFPAIPISKIFDFISNRYGITFEGFFLNTGYFTDLYLYCKSSEELVVYTAPVRINFTSKDVNFPDLDLTTDVYTSDWSVSSIIYQRTSIKIFPTNPAIQYKVTIRNNSNGSVLNTFENNFGYQEISFINQPNGTAMSYYFEVESTAPFSFTSELYNKKQFYFSTRVRRGYSTTQSTGSFLNIQSYIPKIKVIDFFTGIIKLFNLTIVPKGENNFELQPLELFYGFGEFKDITPYVITDNIDILRPKLFKKLSFAHEKSENILNNAFRNTFNREYGDLDYQDLMSNESSSYEIKSPFEDVMWEKTTNQDFLTATLIDKDRNSYKPKPILMYMNNHVTLPTPIKFFNGASYNNVSNYRKFTNELAVGTTIASLNWGEEQSVNVPTSLASNSLFELWYKNYISGLYDIRCRLINLKTKIPTTMLSGLKLNDRIIYKDKKYIFNNFTSNLTNGEVSMELITDFRSIEQPFALRTNYNLTSEAQDIEATIFIGSNDSFITDYEGINDGPFTTDTNVIFNVAENTTGDILLSQIEITYFNNAKPTATKYINIIQEA